MLDISNFIDSSEEKVAFVKYDEKFQLKLRYAAPKDLQSIREKYTKKKFVRGQQIEELDGDKVIQHLCERYVVDWKGLTYRALCDLVPINVDKLIETLRESGQTLDSEIPFNHKSVLQISSNVPGFESWLINNVTDLSNFVSETVSKIEEGLKKSSTTPTGKSAQDQD